MKNQILLSKNILSVNSLSVDNASHTGEKEKSLVATILNNMAYYGFIPSMDMLARLNVSTEEQLVAFWKESEGVFKEFFKDVLDAKEGVVYKNFPAEVLNMSEAEYWFNQIAMYFGVDKSFFTEDEKPREEDTCKLSNLRVLQYEKAGDLQFVFDGFKTKKATLTEKEKGWVSFLLSELSVKKVDISEYAFKGELFEPSKVELQFEVKGNALNKAVVLLDVKNRKLICLDMPFPFLNVRGAGNNIVKIREFLKPLKEYINAQPSVADLLKYTVKSESGVPFVYSDKENPVCGKGFVFKPENEHSVVEQIDLSRLLS